MRPNMDMCMVHQHSGGIRIAVRINTFPSHANDQYIRICLCFDVVSVSMLFLLIHAFFITLLVDTRDVVIYLWFMCKLRVD